MNPLRRLYNRILAESESDSEANGYLSWRGEWHAAAWGLSVGVLFALTREPAVLIAGVGWVFTRKGDAPGWLPYTRQFAKETLYVIAHSVAGVLLGLLVQAVLF
ncbi:hypothetical protein [Halosimplex pelagicum]|uniref:Uncharacterized protein n=1 Tax=Halosimplex pelagicum TaxID=869886 RepID=A0A7D5TH51_9EURY|nr:hypothetical protein [Halosimplex pelagicum]QLH82476.1 hypothetical protein HZS54_13000 [Halosimplex pelagicum]QLH82532.1 hypothetical protein HZS54_13305 [Halosimplex pelagicum]